MVMDSWLLGLLFAGTAEGLEGLEGMEPRDRWREITRVHGRRLGYGESVLSLLDKRGMTPNEHQRDRLECGIGRDLMNELIGRALVATTADEVFNPYWQPGE